MSHLVPPLFPLLLLMLSQPLWAQEPPPPPESSEPEGSVALGVVMPSGISGVQLSVSHLDEEAVLFRDDGLSSFDAPGDGEYWARLDPLPEGAWLRIAGMADGLPIHHSLRVTVPPAWGRSTWPVVFVAVRESGRFRLVPILASERPHFEGGQTGTGLGGWAEAQGFSATALYLLWGATALLTGAFCTLRASVSRIRALPPPGHAEVE